MAKSPIQAIPSEDEGALVRAAQAGDRTAFGAIYERYCRMVYGTILAHAGYGEADDILQDVFLKAMRQIGNLRDLSSLGPWLAAIARRTVLDRRRVRPSEPLLDDVAGLDERPSEKAVAALEAVRRLPAAYRETLLLRLVEGMTGPEIAARTGMTPDSVRVNLSRGMKLLREDLSRHGWNNTDGESE